MNEIILTKESSDNEIELYFREMLRRSRTGIEFPFDFNEVWMLAYNDKRSAVHELKDKFLQGIDYQTVRKKVQSSNVAGYTYADSYMLTSSCLEYFVARKVRPVFEVYRRVFHKVASGEMTQIEKTQQKILYADWVVKFLNLNEASKLRIAQEIGKDTGMVGFLPQGINAGTEHPTLHAAKDLLKENNIPLSSAALNKVLMKKGVIHEATRPSRDKNKPWKWKVLNEGYDYYGQNVQDPNFQSQTQIKWYDNRFMEMLEKLGVLKEQSLGF